MRRLKSFTLDMGFKKWEGFPITITPGMIGSHFAKKCLKKKLKKEAPRCSKYFFDHSKARFTVNWKLALWAQTSSLRAFRSAKNGS